jgi:Ca-activated chloride channel family protein
VQISIKYHRVSVTINNQVATTKVDQVFVNNSPREIEGTYLFPLPENVTINKFVMYMDGKPLVAELMDSQQARKIYEDIVRSRKDPALLEYMGRGAFRARIFPIAPWGEKRIQLEYTEVLPFDAGLCKYQYPLNTEKFSYKPLEAVEVNVKITSHTAIKNIWSPSHENKAIVDRSDDFSANILYADENTIPDTDFVIYYTVSQDDFGLNLMTYRVPPDDGFYVLMAAPNYQIKADDVVNKNVIFVFDTSGSMAGIKIEQAKQALEFCVEKLNRNDEFNIIDFSTGVRKFKPSPVLASQEEVRSALQYINKLEAVGGTDINSALQESLKQTSIGKYPLSMIIFLTDGLPTVGVTDGKKITENTRTANKKNTRLFVFGVGYDVNTILLDDLALYNKGLPAYVRPEQNIEIEISSFFAKVSNPVLSDIKLDFGAINTYDRYPVQIPDLFAGSQIKEFGRYSNSGNININLTGLAGNRVEKFTYPAQFMVENSENDFIPRIWAARKVGYLIEEIRRNGAKQELIDEIKKLSIKYGIINEYISMLILEDEPPPPGVIERQFGADTGKAGVDASAAVQNQKESEVAQSGAQSESVKIVGGKIFVKKNEVWMDAEYKDSWPDVTIQYETNEYFNLAASDPDIGKYLALGKNVVFYYNGKIFRIQEEKPTAVEPSEMGEKIDKIKKEEPRPEIQTPKLWQNYPNPFNPDTWIPYQLSEDSYATIKIYDVNGNLVNKLEQGYKKAGDYLTKDKAVYWNGKNSIGEEVSSGIYFYTLETNKFQSVKKMTLKK